MRQTQKEPVSPDMIWKPGMRPIPSPRPLNNGHIRDFERAIAKPVGPTMETFMASLRRQQPLRVRRLRKDMEWAVRKARRAGVDDPTMEVPVWLTANQ